MTDFITDAERILQLAELLRRQAPHRPIDPAVLDRRLRATDSAPRPAGAPLDATPPRPTPQPGRQQRGQRRGCMPTG